MLTDKNIKEITHATKIGEFKKILAEIFKDENYGFQLTFMNAKPSNAQFECMTFHESHYCFFCAKDALGAMRGAFLGIPMPREQKIMTASKDKNIPQEYDLLFFRRLRDREITPDIIQVITEELDNICHVCLDSQSPCHCWNDE